MWGRITKHAWAIASVAVLLFSVVALLWPQTEAPHRKQTPTEQTDIAMYSRIADRVSDGESYYSAVADEHRKGRYPLEPFYTVRPPTLAWVTAILGKPATMHLAQILLTLAALGLAIRLRANPIEAVAAFILTMVGGFITFYHDQLYHELWAGIFIALAAAAHSRRMPEISAALTLIAVCFREFAIFFPLVFGAFALFRMDRRGIKVWLLCGVLAGLFYAVHARQVEMVRQAGDAISPGWLSAPGLAWVLGNVSGISLLRLLGQTGPFLAAGALSLWAFDSRFRETFAFLLTYIAFVALAARGTNYYWSFMLLPLLFVSLAFLPRVILEALRRNVGKLEGARCR